MNTSSRRSKGHLYALPLTKSRSAITTKGIVLGLLIMFLCLGSNKNLQAQSSPDISLVKSSASGELIFDLPESDPLSNAYLISCIFELDANGSTLDSLHIIYNNSLLGYSNSPVTVSGTGKQNQFIIQWESQNNPVSGYGQVISLKIADSTFLDDLDSNGIILNSWVVEENLQDDPVFTIDGTFDSSQLLVYPNPAITELKVRFPTNANRTVWVSGLKGALMHRAKASGKQMGINLSQFRPGSYFLHVSDEDGKMHTQRFIVAH